MLKHFDAARMKSLQVLKGNPVVHYCVWCAVQMASLHDSEAFPAGRETVSETENTRRRSAVWQTPWLRVSTQVAGQLPRLGACYERGIIVNKIWYHGYHEIATLVFKALNNLAPPYLVDDCNLVSDDTRRQHSAASVTCTVPVSYTHLTLPTNREV